MAVAGRAPPKGYRRVDFDSHDGGKGRIISEGTRGPTVRELGEFALIDRITARRPAGPDVLLGPGDDAAVVGAPDGRVVITTDMLVEGRHFRRDWSAPGEIGRKAIAQNAADVVAMGARPTGFVVALGCPGDTPVADIEDLFDGMWAEIARSGGAIVGGDVVGGERLVVSVTAFGDLGGRAPVTRAGARPGDLVAVAGGLGWSAAGLEILSRTDFPGARVTALAQNADVVVPGADPAAVGRALATHRVPRPPYAAVRELLDHGVTPTALTDVSDGLLADLGHLARASGTRIDVRAAALAEPGLHALAAALDVDAAQWILAGGEDHAFAATFPAGTALPPDWRVIGDVHAGAGVTVDGGGYTGNTGWESFRGVEVPPPGESR